MNNILNININLFIIGHFFNLNLLKFSPQYCANCSMPAIFLIPLCFTFILGILLGLLRPSFEQECHSQYCNEMLQQGFTKDFDEFTNPINHEDYVLYKSSEKQEVSDLLKSSEEQLDACAKSNTCDYTRLQNKLYHTIPEEIHYEYTENRHNSEIRAILKKLRNVGDLLKVAEYTNAIAYPSRKEFEDDSVLYYNSIEMSNNHNSKVEEQRLEISPLVLDFGIKPISIQSQDTFTISVAKGEAIVTAFTSDSKEIQVLTGKKMAFPITITKDSPLKLNVGITPTIFGEFSGCIFIKLKTGIAYLYRVRAYGVENVFEVRPIFATLAGVGQTNVVYSYIRNPYNRDLKITRAYPEKKDQLDVKLIEINPVCSCSVWTGNVVIKPGERVRAVAISYTPPATGFFCGKVIIEGEMNLNLTLLVILKMPPHQLLIRPSILDFGTIVSGSIPHKLDVRVQSRSVAVAINGVLYKPDPNFVINFKDFGKSLIVAPNQMIPIGYVAFYGVKPGFYKVRYQTNTIQCKVLFEQRGYQSQQGKIAIFTNLTEILSAEYMAEVLPVNQFFFLSDVAVDTTKEEPEINREPVHPISMISNGFKNTLVFSQAEIYHKKMYVKLSCHPKHNYENTMIKPCLHKIGSSGTLENMISLRYRQIKDEALPLTVYVSLLATHKLFSVPITFYDSNLYCQYSNYTVHMDSIKKWKVFRKCCEIHEINLGAFADDSKEFIINVTNVGKAMIEIPNIHLEKESSIACISIEGEFTSEGDKHGQFSGIKKEENNHSQYHDSAEYSSASFSQGSNGKAEASGLQFGTDDSKYNNKANTWSPVKSALSPGSHLMIKIILGQEKCGKKYQEKIPLKEHEEISNNLFINSLGPRKQIAIKLRYHYNYGELSFTPSRIRFEPGFPGIIQKKEFRAISTFKTPLTILKCTSSDPRIELKIKSHQILPNSKNDIGIITFDPAVTPDEQSFQAMQSKIMSWEKPGITFKELKLWRDKENARDKVGRSGGDIIDAEMRIETDILQNQKISLKAELNKPLLFDKTEVLFPLTQNGSISEERVTIYNPASVPIIVQLIMADMGLGNHRSAIPVGSYWSKYCDEEGINIGEILIENSKKSWDTFKKNSSHPSLKNRGLSEEEFNELSCCYLLNNNFSMLFKSGRHYIFCCLNIFYKFIGMESQTEDPFQPLKGIDHKIQEACMEKMVVNLEETTEKTTPLHYHPMQRYFSFSSNYSKYPFLIAPHTFLTFGPVKYQPTSLGEHQAMIFVKNNLTVLYPIKLRGISGSGIIEFILEKNRYIKKQISIIPIEYSEILATMSDTSAGKINFRLNFHELFALNTSFYDVDSNLMFDWLNLNNGGSRARTIHIRKYLLKNIGNIPITIAKMKIAGRGCSAYGITIKNCEEFTLGCNQTHKLIIEFNTKFAMSTIKKSLVFETPTNEKQTFEIAIQIPFKLLDSLQKIPSLENNNEIKWRLGILIILFIMGVYAMTTAFKQLLNLNSKEEDPSIEAVLIKHYPIYLQPAEYTPSPNSLWKSLQEMSETRKAMTPKEIPRPVSLAKKKEEPPANAKVTTVVPPITEPKPINEVETVIRKGSCETATSGKRKKDRAANKKNKHSIAAISSNEGEKKTKAVVKEKKKAEVLPSISKLEENKKNENPVIEKSQKCAELPQTEPIIEKKKIPENAAPVPSIVEEQPKKIEKVNPPPPEAVTAPPPIIKEEAKEKPQEKPQEKPIKPLDDSSASKESKQEPSPMKVKEEIENKQEKIKEEIVAKPQVDKAKLDDAEGKSVEKEDKHNEVDTKISEGEAKHEEKVLKPEEAKHEEEEAKHEDEEAKHEEEEAKHEEEEAKLEEAKLEKAKLEGEEAKHEKEEAKLEKEEAKHEEADAKQEEGEIKQEQGEIKQEQGEIKQDDGEVKQEEGEIKSEKAQKEDHDAITENKNDQKTPVSNEDRLQTETKDIIVEENQPRGSMSPIPLRVLVSEPTPKDPAKDDQLSALLLPQSTTKKESSEKLEPATTIENPSPTKTSLDQIQEAFQDIPTYQPYSHTLRPPLYRPTQQLKQPHQHYQYVKKSDKVSKQPKHSQQVIEYRIKKKSTKTVEESLMNITEGNTSIEGGNSVERDIPSARISQETKTIIPDEKEKKQENSMTSSEKQCEEEKAFKLQQSDFPLLEETKHSVLSGPHLDPLHELIGSSSKKQEESLNGAESENLEKPEDELFLKYYNPFSELDLRMGGSIFGEVPPSQANQSTPLKEDPNMIFPNIGPAVMQEPAEKRETKTHNQGNFFSAFKSAKKLFGNEPFQTYNRVNDVGSLEPNTLESKESGNMFSRFIKWDEKDDQETANKGDEEHKKKK